MAIPTPEYREAIVYILMCAEGRPMTTQEVWESLEKVWEVPLSETRFSLDRLVEERRIHKMPGGPPVTWSCSPVPVPSIDD